MNTPGIKQAYIIILMVFLVCHYPLNAQRTISGVGKVLDTGEKTPVQLESEAKKEAIREALYNAFGSMVYSGYERLVETEMSGRSVVSHSDSRIQYAKDFPNGEWMKDITISFNNVQENGNWWKICNATGLAKKIESPKIQFDVKTLDGTNYIMDETSSFVDGENGYIYFKSAEAGYLMIFLDDFQNIQRCLPYNAMRENCYRVEAHKAYVFFSPEHAEPDKNKLLVDEMEFYTDKSFEYNQFYIFFSTKLFSPAILNREDELEDGYFTFKTVERASFHSWLQEQRLKNSELQIKTIGITIKSN